MCLGAWFVSWDDVSDRQETLTYRDSNRSMCRIWIHETHPNFSPTTTLHHHASGASGPPLKRAVTPVSTTPSSASVTQSGREPRLVRNRRVPVDAWMTGRIKCGLLGFYFGNLGFDLSWGVSPVKKRVGLR